MPSVIFRYHDQTKHAFHRYARALGYLDWNTQPDPFRTYAGAPSVGLALTPCTPAPYAALYGAISLPAQPLDPAAIGRLFRFSLGLSAWKEFAGNRWALRVNPSSGNLHPSEGYAMLPPVEGWSDRPGVYHYCPKHHEFELRGAFERELFNAVLGSFPRSSFLVGLSSIPWREAWKYGERGYRYCQHDAGHALAALRMSAALLGWDLRVLPCWDTNPELFGLHRTQDFPPAESEILDWVAVVCPAGSPSNPEREPSPQAYRARLRQARWSGRARQLSPDHVAWPIIDEAIASTHSPLQAATRWELSPTRRRPAGEAVSDAHALLLQRRSAVAFAGEFTLSRATFFRILRRTLPRRHSPWDALWWRPAIHLALFVHRVDGVDPGLYLLVREPGANARLRQAIRHDAAWQVVAGAPPELPLYRLRTGDMRDLAATLSCQQAIAGDSYFSLGMIADFEGPIHAHGPSFYRNLFWESGVVGQVLYLEAEAANARATGIGCYFDDPVHELLGLSGRAFQSLYHFTVGAPVEDARLLTHSPYGRRDPEA